MSRPIDVTLAFVAPAGISGVLRLQHEGGKGKTALLSMGLAGSLDGASVSAPLTAADMRELVDGLMDSIHAMERQERL